MRVQFSDFGRVQPIRQVVFDTGASTGDYPRGYAVTTSADGTHWHPATATGIGQFVSASPAGPVRYVRLTLAADAPNWWSVAAVRANTGR